MNIPIVLTPFEDELLISWIYRLMRVNDIPRITDFEKHAVGCHVTGDGYFNITRLADTLGLPEMSAGRMLVRHTAFPEYCAGTTATQLDDLLGIMTGRSTRTSKPGSIRYCPDCMRDTCDPYGNPVLYRYHQSVSICPVHGIPLMMCSLHPGDRKIRESFWSLSRQETRKRAWLWSKEAFERDFQCARFIMDLIHLELPLTRELLEETILFHLAEHGADCGNINSVLEYLLNTTGFEEGFCLQEAGHIADGLNLLSGRELLCNAHAVFGTADRLAEAFHQAFPPDTETVRQQSGGVYCGCGVFETHAEDGSVLLLRGVVRRGGADEQTHIG